MFRRRTLHQPGKNAKRRGSAMVELAILTPLFVTLTLGAIQTGLAIDATQRIINAARGAGRLAAMDYSDKLQSNQTGNQKVTQDIKNVLAADRIPANQVTVTITHAEGSQAESTFDLSNAANDLKLFRIHVEVPYSVACAVKFLPHRSTKLSATVVLRKEKSGIIQ